MKYNKQNARKEAEANGHYKMPLLKVIRDYCIECCGGNSREPELCTACDCQLHPYRTSHNPFTGIGGGKFPERPKQPGPVEEIMAQIVT